MYKTKKIGSIFAVMMMTFGLLSADDIKPNGCKGPSLCSSYPVIDGCGWHFEAGLLLEQMSVFHSSTSYLRGANMAPNTWENPFRYGVAKHTTFDLDPGLRIGLGYYLKHDEWMINADFEWLSSKGTYKGETETGLFFDDIFNTQASRNELNTWLHIDYYLLDVYLSRGSFISNKFEMEPLAGIKTSWINYNARNYFRNTTGTRLIAIKEFFWGVGPMFGLNFNFHTCAGWSIYSDSNLSVMLGYFDVKEGTGEITIEKLPGQDKIISYWDMLCPTLRTTFGLQYDKDIYCERQHFSLKAGFDGRYYFNQYPIIYQTSIGNRGEPGFIDVPGYFGTVGFILVAGWDF